MGGPAKDDPLSPEVREAERFIDNAFLDNPLMSLRFGEAAWWFLAICEERFVHQLLRDSSQPTALGDHHRAALVDNIILHAKWPLYWLFKTCEEGGKVPSRRGPDEYQAAMDLSEIGLDYLAFESAFTYASSGLLTLRREGNKLLPSGELRAGTAYEAYDRMADLSRKQHETDESFRVATLILPNLIVRDDWFEYSLNPDIVRRCIEWAAPSLDSRFVLPADWTLGGISLGDFGQVHRALWAVSSIHLQARLLAMARGCQGLGMARALVTMDRSELLARLTRYSRVQRSTVAQVVEYLTYGRGGIRHPDPALQPLVMLTPDLYAWSPTIVVNSSLERNLVVLANRVPQMRADYSRLSQQKEALLRDTIIAAAEAHGLRAWYGNVPSWPGDIDIDLVLVSDVEAFCLCLELKSFVAPAEIREVVERSQEIARGIEQVRTRRRLAHLSPQALQVPAGLPEGCRTAWAVVSETSIGGSWVQVDDVPVINAAHFVRRLRTANSLSEVWEWLNTRAYLPTEGTDYWIHDDPCSLGEWSLPWFRVECSDGP